MKGFAQKIRILCVFFASIMFFTVGCSNSEEDNEMVSGMKIAIVSSPYGVDDGNFNENNYNGILKFIEKNPGATVTTVREESGNVAAAVQAVADISADHDVIVCCGLQFAGIGTLAQENTEVCFILVDGIPMDTEGKEIAEGVENIYAMMFKEQEGGFCAGIAAAMESKTGKVAVINGIAYPSSVNYQYGFESGVHYANKYYDANAEIVEMPSFSGTNTLGESVGGNYIGDFADVSGGKVLGEALIAEGVDVIFVAAGASGNGVFQAAKEAEDVLCIGCDVDQYEYGVSGNRNIMLTSVLKVMDRNVEQQLGAIQSGRFVGGNHLLGADTDSIGYVKEEGRHRMSQKTILSLEEALEKLKTGEIVPASGDNGMEPEKFTGL